MSAVSKGREHGAVVHRGVSFVGTLAAALAKDIGLNVRRAVGYPIGLVQGAVLGEAKPPITMGPVSQAEVEDAQRTVSSAY